jgi:hypothetical protein
MLLTTTVTVIDRAQRILGHQDWQRCDRTSKQQRWLGGEAHRSAGELASRTLSTNLPFHGLEHDEMSCVHHVKCQIIASRV